MNSATIDLLPNDLRNKEQKKIAKDKWQGIFANDGLNQVKCSCIVLNTQKGSMPLIAM